MVMMGGVTYTTWLCARLVSQRKELKCISTGSKKKKTHLIFCSNLGMSIAVGKIRTVTTSAGSYSAQSPGTGKVEISRAEGGVSAAESPQASASSSFLLANQSSCFSCRYKDLELEQKHSLFVF